MADKELQKIMAEIKKSAPYSSSQSDEELFNKAVFEYSRIKQKSVSEWIWIISGTLVLSCSILFSFSIPYEGMKDNVGVNFQILVALLWGILITVYVPFYAATHYKKITRLHAFLKSIRKMNI